MRCPFQTINMPFISIYVPCHENRLLITLFQYRRTMRMYGLTSYTFITKIFNQIHFTISVWIARNLRHNPCSRKVSFLQICPHPHLYFSILKGKLMLGKYCTCQHHCRICRIRIRNNPTNQSSISNKNNICRIRIPLCPKIICTRNPTP